MIMERFIEAVKAQPCLWNPMRGDYREAVSKDIAWQTVIERAKMPHIKNLQTAKQEWKKLRDNHRDALKRAKLGKNKLLPAQITTWKYAKSMQFLEPHMKYRVTEHIEPDASYITSDYQEEEDNHTRETSSDFDVSTSYNSKKRKYTGSETSNTENKSLKYDGLSAFFNFMSESVKAMPPSMQTQVKKKIFNIVVQAEEELSTSTSMIGVDVLIDEPDNSSVNLASYDNDDTDEDNAFSVVKVKSEVPENTEGDCSVNL